jgi:hypothetical protein
MAAALLCAAYALPQTPAIPTGPWKDLFNKKDLTGWSQQGNPPWSVVNGVLQTKGGSTKTYLIWPEPIKDLELEITYKLSTTNANSGIQVRSHCSDKTKTLPNCGGSYVVCGPQLDVAQSYSGRLFEECAAFLQFDGQNIDNCRRTLKVGEWTTTTARLEGAKISLWLNGTFCLDYTFTNAEHLDGNIFAIQSHPPFDLIEWQSIKIRKLNVSGCTNPKATNYNAEATKDDGSCKMPTGLTSMERKEWKGSVAMSGSTVTYDIPEAGEYRVRLLDVNGAVAGRAAGNGPVVAGELRLDRPGIYFLEVDAAGAHTRHRIDNF